MKRNEIDLVDQSISDSLPTEKPSGHQDRDKKGPDTPQSWTVKWTLIGLQILLWFTLWGFCIQNEFGSVYILLSLFYFIYKGTRTGPKDNKKLSAYSVFNPNCERIDGTFTAEQFEKELRYGAGAVK